MKLYDWIVVGGGLAGSALGYELAKVGCSVLLLEQSAIAPSATRYSYGGIAYWAGGSPLMTQLCQEGIELHRQLSDELGADTQFREIDLLLTIAPDRPPETVAAAYAGTAIPPALVTPEIACEIEPLLNPEAISAALLLRHGHVDPEAIAQAYQTAMCQRRGTVEFAQVTGFLGTPEQVEGVKTPTDEYRAAQVVVCAGGLSRSLLVNAGLSLRMYYTQAEILETPPLDLKLNALIMPAELQRFGREAQASDAAIDARWDQPGHELVPPILDAGAVQLQDGRIRIGQWSRFQSDLTSTANPAESEAMLRGAIAPLLPTLKDVPGQWHCCLVAFSGDRLPLVGAVIPGLSVFSGFSNPFAILPPIARRFARAIAQSQPDPLLTPMSPTRFG